MAKYENKAQEICGLLRISTQSTSQDSTLETKNFYFYNLKLLYYRDCLALFFIFEGIYFGRGQPIISVDN